MIRFFVTGVGGQLGHDVVKELKNRGFIDIIAPTREQLDLSFEGDVRNAIKDTNPDVVIHCAAYTQVDAAEDNEDIAKRINVDCTRYIAEECKNINSKLIYISTDYVFDGTKPLDEVYETTDQTNPQNVYGKTKLEGEKAAFINPKTFVVRTSWVFGINGKNFVKTMLNLSETRDELNVVSDQFGSPTYTVDLAKLLVDMSLTDKYGLYHANNEGYCNWAEFAEAIFKENDKNVKVNYITSDEYPQKATRPKNSKLSKQSLVNADFDLLPNWNDALHRYCKELSLALKK